MKKKGLWNRLRRAGLCAALVAGCVSFAAFAENAATEEAVTEAAVAEDAVTEDPVTEDTTATEGTSAGGLIGIVEVALSAWQSNPLREYLCMDDSGSTQGIIWLIDEENTQMMQWFIDEEGNYLPNYYENANGIWGWTAQGRQIYRNSDATSMYDFIKEKGDSLDDFEADASSSVLLEVFLDYEAEHGTGSYRRQEETTATATDGRECTAYRIYDILNTEIQYLLDPESGELVEIRCTAEESSEDGDEEIVTSVFQFYTGEDCRTFEMDEGDAAQIEGLVQ